MAQLETFRPSLFYKFSAVTVTLRCQWAAFAGSAAVVVVTGQWLGSFVHTFGIPRPDFWTAMRLTFFHPE